MKISDTSIPRAISNPKTKSAPSFPPSLAISVKDDTTQAAPKQEGGPKTPGRRASEFQPLPGNIPKRRKVPAGSQHSLARQHALSLKLRKDSFNSQKTANGAPQAEENAPTPEQTEGTGPEDLAELFQRICRITNYPAHQAFPFFLDLEERRLAHYWFTEVLKDDFGMKLQLEETFQGQLTRYPLAFQVPLRWIIAKAGNRLHEKTGSQSLAVVYRSRQKALNRLQEILHDGNTSTDEVVGSILQSIVHNPEFRKVHLRGLDAIINSRGGLETVVRESTVTCAEHIFLQYTFTEFEITRLDELEKLKSRFFSALLAMRDEARESTEMTKQMAAWASSVDLVDYSFDTDKLQKWSYTEQRQRVFSPRTATGQLIRQPFSRHGELMRTSRLFAALFQISALLIQYDTVEQKCLFLRRVEEAAKIAARPAPDTGLPTVMAGAHIYMTGYVSRQIQAELGMGRHDIKGIPVAMDSIAAIKIFGLLTDSMRAQLHRYLQGWLLGEEGLCFGEDDVRAMDVVITKLWKQRIRENKQDGGAGHLQPEPVGDC